MLSRQKCRGDALVRIFNDSLLFADFSAKIITDFRYNAQKYYICKEEKNMKKLYKTTKPNTFISVELLYNKGGENTYSRAKNPRCYMLYINAVERVDKNGCMMETYEPYTAMRVNVLEVARASKKAAAEAEKYAENFSSAWAMNYASKYGYTLVD